MDLFFNISWKISPSTSEVSSIENLGLKGSLILLPPHWHDATSLSHASVRGMTPRVITWMNAQTAAMLRWTSPVVDLALLLASPRSRPAATLPPSLRRSTASEWTASSFPAWPRQGRHRSPAPRCVCWRRWACAFWSVPPRPWTHGLPEKLDPVLSMCLHVAQARLAPLLDQSSPAFRWKHGRGPDMFSIRRPSLRAYQPGRVPHPLGHDIERTLPFFCGADAPRSGHTALVGGLPACTLTRCLRPCVPSLLDALATTKPQPHGAANRGLQASAMKFSMVDFSVRTRHARCFTRAEANDWFWWSVWIRNRAGRTGREPRTSSTTCSQVWLEWSRGGHHTVPPLFDPRRLAKHSFLFGQLAATTRAAWGGAEHVLDTRLICTSWERSLFRWRGKAREFRPLVTETRSGVPPPRNSVCRTSWCDDDMELSFHARGPEQLLFRHVLRPEGCPRLSVSDQSLRFSLSWPRENLHVSRSFLHLEDLHDAICQLFTRSQLDTDESWRHQILLRPSFQSVLFPSSHERSSLVIANELQPRNLSERRAICMTWKVL